MEEKVIINEFLTFVQNKIDVVDELSIVQICVTNFTAEEIEIGKTELFNALISEGVKHVQRKGEDKSKKNIKDVIKAFKETEPTRQPTFVAKDLNKLPPVSFDHVDVTRLLKDIVFLKNELQTLRLDSVTKSEMSLWQAKISTDIMNLKTLSTSDRQNELQHQGNKAESSTKKGKRSERCRPNGDACSDVQLISPSERELFGSMETIVDAAPTYRDIVLCPTVSYEPQAKMSRKPIAASNYINRHDNTEFTLVENKRRKHRSNYNLRGSAQRASTIQAAEIPISLYVSRLSKSTTSEHMISHIKEMGHECIDVQLLKQKYETSFNSFKILVSRSKLDTFLKSDFWPEGVKFRVFRERAVITGSASSSTQNE